jgi:hypothetical protein
MDATCLPVTVERCLQRYRNLLEQYAPQCVAAFYVHGSLALGAYEEGRSDIDFIAFLNKEAGDETFKALAQVHHHLLAEFPHSPLEGSYLQWHDLGRPLQQIPPYPCYHDGRMYRAARHDINPVTWWMLRQRAIVIFGPAPDTLDFRAEWDSVHAYMLANLNHYWASYTTRPPRMAMQLRDGGIHWTVLGICRLYYGLREGNMISKRQAGEYALAQTPAEWHPLIQEALNLRAGIKTRHYRSRLGRARACIAFVKYIIADCQSAASSTALPR